MAGSINVHGSIFVQIDVTIQLQKKRKDCRIEDWSVMERSGGSANHRQKFVTIVRLSEIQVVTPKSKNFRQ